MGTAITGCPGCGAPVPRRSARFCGDCGATIDNTGSSPDDTRTDASPSLARSAGRTRIGVALAVVIAVTAAVIAATFGSGWPGGVLDDTSPTPSEEPDAQGPNGLGSDGEVLGIGPDTPVMDRDDDRDDDRDPAGPSVDGDGPLRCVPEGCEAWQLPSPSGDVAGSSGVLYLLDAERLSAWTEPFETERWSVDLRDLVSVTGDGDPIGGLGTPDDPALLRADPDGVVVITSSDIVRHDREGVRQWRKPVGGWRVWDAVAVDGRHLVTRSRASDGGIPFGRVGVLDLDDGSERWTRQVTQVHGVTDEFLVAGGLRGEVSAFDLDVGSPLWQRSVSQQTAIRVVGPVIHLEPMFPEARPRGRLISPATGRTPAHLEGGVLSPPLLVGGKYVTVLEEVGDGATVQAVALEADGTVAWNRRLPAAREPDPSATGTGGSGVTTARLRDLTDGTRITVEAGTARKTLRVRDGVVLTRSEAPSGEAPSGEPTEDGPDGPAGPDGPGGSGGGSGAAVAGWRTIADDVAVREGPDHLQLRGPGGGRVVVRGGSPHLVSTDPLVVRSGDRLHGLRVGTGTPSPVDPH